jgi:hypothetical protein
VVPVADRPYFFLPSLLFFQRDWPCDPIFSRWLRAAHTACQNGVCYHTNYWTKYPKFVHRKYASLVNIDVGTLLQIAQQKTAKTMKKIFKKKIYFRPTDPNFFTIWNPNHRYFFYPRGPLTQEETKLNILDSSVSSNLFSLVFLYEAYPMENLFILDSSISAKLFSYTRKNAQVVTGLQTIIIIIIIFIQDTHITYVFFSGVLQVVTNLFTSCQQVVFALLVPSCCNKFGTSS